MVGGGLVEIQFVRSWGCYNGGEIASFPATEAKRILSYKPPVAQLYRPPPAILDRAMAPPVLKEPESAVAVPEQTPEPPRRRRGRPRKVR